MTWAAAVLLLGLCTADAADAAGRVTLTPWCDNSMRVRVAPSSMPPSAVAAQKALAKSLASKNMTDLAGAMVTTTCTPGAAVTPAAGGAKTTNGNLEAALGADGTMSFTRADTGALLFSAKPSFSFNGDPAPKPQAPWEKVENRTVTCSGSEFGGSTGSADSAEECLAAVKASGVYHINYAIYNSANKGCFMCDMSDRGPYTGPASWGLKSHIGAVSWVMPTPFPAPGAGYFAANLTVTAADKSEVVYGLGQGGWTPEGGCPAGGLAGAVIVPLERNGQSVNLQQRKFHVSIPFVTSTAGYGFLFNMPGHGEVRIGAHGVGGAAWSQKAALYLDYWVTALPAKVVAPALGPIYHQYADATGHAPPLREDAMSFWQSRNRYKSSDIALSIADRYQQLKLDVGVLVIDYKNQLHDGDWAPNPACYPSVKALASGVREKLNGTLMFSFWPEVKATSAEYPVLKKAGCLINPDLGGFAFDATIPECRELVWSTMLKPRYYDQGVDAYWLDETDGEGTAGGGDGDYGYNTSYGPALSYSNLWVNEWLSMYSDPVAAEPEQVAPPLVLTRGVWAGGQRHGIVLWSSDIHSSFEQLASQVPQGVHASMSGIPWWTTDVGGYGCGESRAPMDPYMQQLIVR